MGLDKKKKKTNPLCNWEKKKKNYKLECHKFVKTTFSAN